MKRKFLSALLCLCMMMGTAPAITLTAQAANNPYPYWQEWDDLEAGKHYKTITCTWFAWQQVYDNLGIALPVFGDGFARNWLSGAPEKGYHTGTEPRVGSIACWCTGGWGHVAYVTAVDSNSITYNEGGSISSHCQDKVNGIYYGHTLPVGGDYYTPWPDGFIYPGGSSAPSQPTANLGDDFYAYIYNPHSDRNVENHSFNVQIATKAASDPRQIWHFIRQGDGSYKIINMYDGLYLEVSDAQYAAGANIQVMTGSNGENLAQKWLICGDGTNYYLTPMLSDTHRYVLDVVNAGATDGTDIRLSTNLYENNDLYRDPGSPFHWAQTFNIQKISNIKSTLAYDYGEDFYARVSYMNSYLQISDSVLVDGNAANVETYNVLDENDPRQIWHFIRQSDGTYKIVNEYKGWYLDITDSAVKNGTKVCTRGSDSGGITQRWYLIRSPEDTTYRIASAAYFPSPVYSLDVPVSVAGTQAMNGMIMTVNAQHQNSNQRFMITKIPYTEPNQPTEPVNITAVKTRGGGIAVFMATQAAGQYFIAAYEQSGQFLASEIVDKTSSTAETLTAMLTGASDAVYVKAFLLDRTTYRPLAVAARTVVQ